MLYFVPIMGNFTSKLFSHHNEQETKISQTPGTPCSLEKMRMCTPPITKRKLTTDPRSATMGITRTPIEVTCTPPALTRRVASALPKYLQGKRYLETDFDAVLPATPEKCIPDPRSPNVSQQRTPIMVKQLPNYVSPVVTINQAPNMETPEGGGVIVPALDPRSPAIDFDRTPILKSRISERSQAHSMENINGTTDCANIGSVRLSYCETTADFRIPEIQAISEIIDATHGSLSTENRLDLCESPKNSISSCSSSTEDLSDGSENEEQITVISNPKILTSSSDPISTWTEDKTDDGTNADVAEKNNRFDESLGKTLDSNISEIINSVMKNQTLSEQKSITNNDKIKVWRDSISPNINDEMKNVNHKNNEEIMIEFDDETTMKSTKNVNTTKSISKVEDDKSKNPVKKRKPQQLQVKSENKNGSDERKMFDNEGKNPIEAALNRTPLGNRSNNHKQRQLITAKSPQQLLRNKGLSARTLEQENTPPHTERFISKTKSNGIQWDPDTTVII